MRGGCTRPVAPRCRQPARARTCTPGAWRSARVRPVSTLCKRTAAPATRTRSHGSTREARHRRHEAAATSCDRLDGLARRSAVGSPLGLMRSWQPRRVGWRLSTLNALRRFYLLILLLCDGLLTLRRKRALFQEGQLPK